MSRKISGVLIDLNGTLHVEDLAIPGAVEALEKLRKVVKVKFVTNTSKESRNLIHNRLAKCGFKIEKNEIFTSLIATRDYVEKSKLRPFLIVDEQALEDFEGIETTDPNAVVIGLAPKMFHDEVMNKAFRLIKEKNAALIAINKSRYFQKKDGLKIGPGAYITGLEYSTGVEAKVVGKPERSFFEMGLESLSVGADEAVMIGDDPEDDVNGAIRAGMRGILVKTGKYREGDEQKIIDGSQRNVAESFVEAVDMIIANKVL